MLLPWNVGTLISLNHLSKSRCVTDWSTLNVCIYICIYIYMYLYIYVYIYAHMDTLLSSRFGQSLWYSLERWPPLQANTPKLPVIHSPYSLFIPPGSNVRSVLPDVHVILSRHAGRSGSGWIDIPCRLLSVCQRHALTLPPLRFRHLGWWHGHHSHVSQADAACPPPGVLSQRPSTVVEWMENNH